MPIVHFSATGQSLYALFDNNATVPIAVDLTEGADYYLSRYYASDSAILAAGLVEGKYNYTIRLGTAATKASNDIQTGAGGEYRFNGVYEITHDDATLVSLVAASTSDDAPQLDDDQLLPTVQMISGIYTDCDCVVTTSGISELHRIANNTQTAITLADVPSVSMVYGTVVKILASKTLANKTSIDTQLVKILSSVCLQSGTLEIPTSQTVFGIGAGINADDIYNNYDILIETDTIEMRKIVDYSGIDQETTIDSPTEQTLTGGENFWILPSSHKTINTKLGTPANTSLAADIAAVDSTVTTIETDTNELQSTGVSLTSSQAASLAAQIETYIINDGDAAATLQAIADKISADWIEGDASPIAIAAAVRTALTAELAHIATIQGKLPAEGRNMAGAGDTTTNLDDINVTANNNITSINDITVQGSGTAGDPWTGVP